MIESKTIDPLTFAEDTQKASDERMAQIMKQIRGLNTAVQNTQLGQVSYEDWQTIGTSAGSNTKPWTITHGGTGATGSATGTQIGQVYTTNTTNPWQNLTTITGTNPNIFHATGTDYNMKVGQSGQIDIQGKDADIRINGKSMTKWMEQVEQRLNILSPNPELEKEWDDLRRLGERYRKLEKKCQEKAQMWEALKKLPKTKS